LEDLHKSAQPVADPEFYKGSQESASLENRKSFNAWKYPAISAKHNHLLYSSGAGFS
jgi:hypothetical protein